MANKHHKKEKRKEREEKKKKSSILQSKPVNTDTEGTIERFRINRVSALSELNLGKMEGISLPREK